MNATVTTTVKKVRLYIVKAQKGAGPIIKQALTSKDQAERWKKLVKENGYKVLS